ncbi:unnamed protein product [Trichogramma brassicae]|uniref:Uncharacterized protein n=1 Tax=Trichogramma brassicae TaxID=86971 RepID=A0A6H5I800_9HYME|nr:unnamed protein product [Trichogramma brassicae]
MEKDKLSETHHRRKIAEDHIALIKEPGVKYLAYAAPKSGKAEEVCETLIDKLIEYKAPLEQLRVIGSDGTNVNTGSKGGIIRYVTLHSTLYRTENLRIHYVRSSYKNIDRLRCIGDLVHQSTGRNQALSAHPFTTPRKKNDPGEVFLTSAVSVTWCTRSTDAIKHFLLTFYNP